MKTLIILFLAASTLTAANHVYSHSAYGEGFTRSEALVSALKFIPNNANIQNPSFNGYSVREYVTKVGYIQTQGSYKCTVRYEK